MINYETILSLFDDKLTLLEYLTKIEKALKDSTLTEITIEQPTETTAVFTFVFENGDTIVTPSVTLPRGEKGDTGDKGDKGDKGDTGEAGADGVSVTSAEINASNHLIITLSNGNTIDAGEIAGIKILDIGSFTISASQAGGKIGDTTITTTQRDILVASYNYILKTTITVAGSSTGTAFYLYRTSGNVYKTLGTTDRYYVNISVNSDTQSLWFDQGTVQDKNIIAPNATQGQVLTADGSGGASWQNAGGGGSGKYAHYIAISKSATAEGGVVIKTLVISSSSTAVSTLRGFNSLLEGIASTWAIFATGYYNSSSKSNIIIQITHQSNNTYANYFKTDGSMGYSSLNISSETGYTVSDTVIAL